MSLLRDGYLAWAAEAEDHAVLEKAKDHARASWKGRPPEELEALLADMELAHAEAVCEGERTRFLPTEAHPDLAPEHWYNAADESQGTN